MRPVKMPGRPPAVKRTMKDDSIERVLLPQQEEYITLIVYMPATVGNNANNRGDASPTSITLDAV